MRHALVPLGIVLLVALGLGGYFLERQRAVTTATLARARAKAALAKASQESVEPQVQAFCGDCHATPKPSSFPKDAWFSEAERGFRFYDESGRTDLKRPALDAVVNYFRAQAPDELTVPASSATADTGRFRPQAVNEPVGGDTAYSSVRPIAWSSPTARELLFTEMRRGTVSVWTVNQDQPAASVELAELKNPAHAEPCDLDGDGLTDLVVADLGSFLPEDHTLGRIVWLRRTADGVETVVLKDGVGRVADVQPADFDGDGDLDLVVAEFGWQTTGSILLLENTASAGSPPTFESRVLDKRHGTIHVPVIDLNGDGRLDFVALISQEYETIVAFLNQGDLKFRPEVLHDTRDPSFGSSGIQLVDLDADGDTDVLYTNGDTLDSFYIKPYHGIQWLENTGGFPFKEHRLLAMPGVSRAVAGDLDGDGDLDIAATAYLPLNITNRFDIRGLESTLWMERTESGWTPRSLEKGRLDKLALDLADLDGDGDLEIVTPRFTGASSASQNAFTVWWNDPHAAK